MLKLKDFSSFGIAVLNYRQEFRSRKITHSETYTQFAVKLGRTLDYWLESIKVPQTFDDLSSFVLADHFIASISPDLRVFIKEHNVQSLPELVILADDWSIARSAYPKDPNKFLASKTQKSFQIYTSNNNRNLTHCNENVNSKPPLHTVKSHDPNYKFPAGTRTKNKCFHCRGEGHIKSRCS